MTGKMRQDPTKPAALDVMLKLLRPSSQVGIGELLLNSYRLSVWGDEQVLEIDSGDVCTSL